MIAKQLYDDASDEIARGSDRMFLWVLLVQWAVAIVIALGLTPYEWAGSARSVHFHVKLAIGFGGAINALPLALIALRPGWWLTRHVIAIAQMLWSGVLVMITGGRIETHFHVFGSLAFLATYRDWRVLLTGTLVVVADHLARGLLWPDSMYGVANPEWWRVLEHSGWVLFEDIVLVHSCLRQRREMRKAAARSAAVVRTKERVEQQVAERTMELQDSVDRYRALVENTSAVPFEWDRRARRLVYIAPQAAQRLGVDPDELDDDRLFTDCVHPDDRARLADAIEAALRSETGRLEIDYRCVTRANRLLHVRVLFSCDAGERHVRGVLIDLTEQRRLELELRQAQKLESVGRLAAGVAHEINTPVQYVGDSVQFIRDSVGDLFDVLGKHRAVTALVRAGTDPAEAARVAEAADDEADLGYLVDEYPSSLDRALDGIHRVAVIVRSMKVFAHPDQGRTLLDLNDAIASTLTIASSEYKYIAELETNFGDLPRISCFAGEVNQVVLNLVVNAAHAIDDARRTTGGRGKIVITTSVEGNEAVIAIRDSGCGIPESIRERIFDPFFTTKEVGRGTGQGLAIARKVIVELHGGSLTFDTAIGVGTTFYIRLPIAPAASTAMAA